MHWQWYPRQGRHHYSRICVGWRRNPDGQRDQPSTTPLKYRRREHRRYPNLLHRSGTVLAMKHNDDPRTPRKMATHAFGAHTAQIRCGRVLNVLVITTVIHRACGIVLHGQLRCEQRLPRGRKRVRGRW